MDTDNSNSVDVGEIREYFVKAMGDDFNDE